MSIFSALTQISSNTVDAVMSERLRLVPRVPGRNSAGGIDPNRAARDVVGVYREVMKRTKVDSSHVGKALDHSFQTPAKTVSIDVAQLGAAVFRAGDRIIRLEQPGEPEFEIAFPPESDGRTRLVFTIGPVS